MFSDTDCEEGAARKKSLKSGRGDGKNPWPTISTVKMIKKPPNRHRRRKITTNHCKVLEDFVMGVSASQMMMDLCQQ